MDIIIKEGNEFIISLKGRLDTLTSKELEVKVNEITFTSNLVILDFSNLDYISSAGLREILNIKKRLDSESKSLEIHNINDVIKEVFSITGFINVLTVK